MSFIKVWCEYDISGSFGGSNNEEVFFIPDDFEGDVEELLQAKYGYLESELELEDGETLFDSGLFDWSYIDVASLA